MVLPQAGGQEIYTEMGTASQAGIIAVGLARSGMECSETLLEGKAGLFAALSASEGVALYNKGLSAEAGKGILDVNFKPVPGCNYAQTPLAVALRVAQKHKPAGKIKGVRVGCTSGAKNYPGCDNPGPFSTIQQTKMSIQFGVCAVLMNAKVSEEVFKQFDSKEITKLASECIVEALPEYLEPFKEGRQPAKVTVTLSDGSTVSEDLSDVPWLDAEAVENRLHEEMGTIMTSPEARKELVEAVKGLGSSRDCSNLFRSFQTASAL
jgi:2-methylcitrate dehydratase PrpD